MIAGHDISHLDLLAAARQIDQAALAHDVDGVHRGLCELRNLLGRHVQLESSCFDDLPPAAAEAIRNGQRKLLEVVDELLVRSERDEGSCRCLDRSMHLKALLLRQAQVELRLERDVTRR